MKRLGILLLFALCSIVQAKEKEIVFLGQDFRFRLDVIAMRYGEVPYSRMDCPTTKSCFVTYRACEAVELVKQDQERTIIRVDWMLPSKVKISGNVVGITFKDEDTCRKFADSGSAGR